MTESVGNNEIWQICNLPWKVHFCNRINRTDLSKNILNLNLKNPVSANYGTKTSILFSCFIANKLSHCSIVQFLPF
jgi:hypothetical protein